MHKSLIHNHTDEPMEQYFRSRIILFISLYTENRNEGRSIGAVELYPSIFGDWHVTSIPSMHEYGTTGGIILSVITGNGDGY